MASLVRRSNGIYYLVSSHNGKRTWLSTGERLRPRAEGAFRNLVHREPVKGEPTSSTLTAFAENLYVSAVASPPDEWTVDHPSPPIRLTFLTAQGIFPASTIRRPGSPFA